MIPLLARALGLSYIVHCRLMPWSTMFIVYPRASQPATGTHCQSNLCPAQSKQKVFDPAGLKLVDANNSTYSQGDTKKIEDEWLNLPWRLAWYTKKLLLAQFHLTCIVLSIRPVPANLATLNPVPAKYWLELFLKAINKHINTILIYKTTIYKI